MNVMDKINMISKLADLTLNSVAECKDALEKTDWDIYKAELYIRKKSISYNNMSLHDKLQFHHTRELAEKTTQTILQLRELTGRGLMDCKKAVYRCDGDIEKAKQYLREHGAVTALITPRRGSSKQ